MKRKLTGLLLLALLCTLLAVPAAAQELPDHDELFAGYVEQLFYGKTELFSTGTKTAGSQLTGVNKTFYDQLVPKIKAIAAGTETSTVMYTTLSPSVFSQLDGGLVVKALLTDLPYELYWFDKVTPGAATWSYDGSGLYMSLKVAQAYQGSDNLHTDAAKTGAAASAAANAQSILTANASKDDYSKLLAYKDAICGLTGYNDAAAKDDSTPFGDPWQLIYVFDGDPATTVVCEGYSKAFQYLCDQTAFSGSAIQCYTVSGYMYGGTGSGGHMWNIVTMDDGKHYLADVTNSDAGTAGSDGSLFLAGSNQKSQVEYTLTYPDETVEKVKVDAYTFGSLRYDYGFDMEDLWGSLGILELASSDYVYTPSACTHSFAWETDSTSHWQKCSLCGEIRNKQNHSACLTAVAEVSASCTAGGTKAHYRCACGQLYSDSAASTAVTEGALATAALGHLHASFNYNDAGHWSICARSGCDAELREAHAFTRTDSKAYVKTPATCKEHAVYFKRCKCGAVSKTETFTDPTEALAAHDYSDGLLSWNSSTHMPQCGVCAGVHYSGQTPHVGDPCVYCSYSKNGPAFTIQSASGADGTYRLRCFGSQLSASATYVFYGASYDAKGRMIDIAFSKPLTGVTLLKPALPSDRLAYVPTITGLDTEGAVKLRFFAVNAAIGAPLGRVFSRVP